MQASLNASTDISLHNIGNYRLPNEEVDALCQSMLKLRAAVEKLEAVQPAMDDKQAIPFCNNNSDLLSSSDLQQMVVNWLTIEDDTSVINQEVDEAVEELLHTGTDVEEISDSEEEDLLKCVKLRRRHLLKCVKLRSRGLMKMMLLRKALLQKTGKHLANCCLSSKTTDLNPMK